jgi:hypothetical protein
MILQESPRLYDEAIRLLRAEYGMDQLRTGTHVSSLIYCLTKEYLSRHDPLPVTEEEVVMYAIGFGLERLILHRNRVEPFEVDGITLSLDGTALGLGVDVKTTRMAPTSSAGCAVCGEPYKGHSKTLQRKVCTCGHPDMAHVDGKYECLHQDEPSEVYECVCGRFVASEAHAYEKAPPVAFELPIGWQKQFMAYVYGSSVAGWGGEVGATRPFGVVVVHLIPAVIKAYEVRWTASELEANWAWLLERKATLARMEAEGVSEPFQHRLYEEECLNCRYSLMCGLQASINQIKETAAVES